MIYLIKADFINARYLGLRAGKSEKYPLLLALRHLL